MASEYLANIEDNKVLYRLNSGYDSEEYNHYIYQVVVKKHDYVTLITYIVAGSTSEILKTTKGSVADYIN